MSSPFIIIDEIEDKIDEINTGLSSTLSTINTNITTVINNTAVNNTASTTGTLSQKMSSAIANTATNNTASKTGILSQKLSYLIEQNTTHGTQTYSTAGTYTWTAPAGVSMVIVNVVGGGGGGGGSVHFLYKTSQYANISGSGGSGGAGAYIFGIHKVSAGTGYTVVVGAGGTGGAGSPAPTSTNTSEFTPADSGGAGGYSRFGDIRANGGNGGGGRGGLIYTDAGAYSGYTWSYDVGGAAGVGGKVNPQYSIGVINIHSNNGNAGSKYQYYTSGNFSGASGATTNPGAVGFCSAGAGGAGAGSIGPNNKSSYTATYVASSTYAYPGLAGSAGGAGKVVIWW